ncbi:phosphoserine phosphatase SerB [Methylocella sp.]|uniref:phosphoserine phosphatase SerB n=1 Tax=Methylocella sp. TaxID=1978226 RepID=UPI0037830257
MASSQDLSASPNLLAATLVCAPSAPALTPALARAATAAVAAARARWLAEGVALDLLIPAGPAPAEAEMRLRGALDGAPVDVIVQNAAGRRKKLFVADMDSTMIGQECVDELAAEVGLKDHVAAITERAMRGEIPFEDALRERVALLRGLPGETAGAVIAKAIRPTPGGRALVMTMRRHGARAVLASGGFTAFTSVIAAKLGFDADYANRLELDEDGRFAGTVAEPIFGAGGKLETLERLRAELGLARDETLAVGDGANDLPMLKAAGLGVAFHGKPRVAAEAGARVDHGDLTALLYAQGYAREEFLED